MSDAPTTAAWDQHPGLISETEFTPDADHGWLSWNGQSPELEVCEFAAQLVTIMRPALVVETGVGQGYMTRFIAARMAPPQQLVCYESHPWWRQSLWTLPFWQENRFFARIAEEETPPYDIIAQADLCVFDSDFEFRGLEIVTWDYWAKTGAVALIHDTADREGTVHQTIRDLIIDMKMTGVFLQNPRGAFMAVQPAKEKTDASSEETGGAEAVGEEEASGGG